jgi:hypothetical protein
MGSLRSLSVFLPMLVAPVFLHAQSTTNTRYGPVQINAGQITDVVPKQDAGKTFLATYLHIAAFSGNEAFPVTGGSCDVRVNQLEGTTTVGRPTFVVPLQIVNGEGIANLPLAYPLAPQEGLSFTCGLQSQAPLGALGIFVTVTGQTGTVPTAPTS